MFEIAKLQMRKNRLIFVGMGLTILGSIPFAAGIALYNGHPSFYGIDSALYFWSFLGLPVVAVLLGSSSGAANASDPLVSAEELFPVSPVRSAFASIGASIAHMAILTVAFLLVAFLVSAQWRESLILVVPGVSRWLRAVEEPIVRPMFWLCVSSLPLFVAASFCIAYWVRNGIVGGALGLGLVATTVVTLAGGAAIEIFYAYRAPFTGKMIFLWIGSLSAIMWAASEIARRVGRRENYHWRRMVLIGGALSIGTLGSLIVLTKTWSRVSAGVSFVGSDPSRWGWDNRLGGQMQIEPVAARRASLQGALLTTLEGGVSFVYPDGRRKKLAPPAKWQSMVGGAIDGPIRNINSAVWDRFGKVWVVRNMPGAEGKGNQYEFWRGDMKQGLSYHSSTPSYWWRPVFRIGDEVGFIEGTENITEFARVGEDGKFLGREVLEGNDSKYIAKEWLRQRNAGHLSSDGMTFKAILPDGTSRTWRMPGPAAYAKRNDGVRLAVRALGKTFYPIEFSLASGVRAIALLEFDGSVRVVWQGDVGNWPYMEATPRGGLHSTEAEYLYAMTALGEFLPKTNLSGLLAVSDKGKLPGSRWKSPYELVRVDVDKVWFVVNTGRLISIRAGSGNVVDDIELPESPLLEAGRKAQGDEPLHIQEKGWQVAEEGLFWHTGRHLHFVDWKGKIKGLGKA